MDLQLKGKACLVTGSNTGIGEVVAKTLAREGARVAVHGRDAVRTRAVADEICRAGGEAVATVGDLSSRADADRVAETALAAFGAIDVLVNNAGHGNPRGPVEWMDTTEEDFLKIYDDNVVSGVRMIHRLVPQMKQRKWGRIIMISSAAGAQPIAQMPDYGATKAAIINYTVSLSKALARTGVTANCVSPGPIKTALLKRELVDGLAAQFGWGTDEAVVDQRCAEFFDLPAGRLGSCEDVGNLVAFLASPLTDFITGSNYRVDGGMVKSVN